MFVSIPSQGDFCIDNTLIAEVLAFWSDAEAKFDSKEFV